MPFYFWSDTAASNGSADPTVNYLEGQAPSSLNDSARAAMAALRRWGDDISGALITAGTATAYTLTSLSVFDSLAHMNAQMIAFTPHATNTNTIGNDVTLNVDGLGAKAIRSSPNVGLPSGSLILGTPYVATYNNSDGAWYLQGGAANAYSIPLAGGMDYWASTAPNSAFAFPAGQAISRTTYATLFALISTTYGTGDGSTTFNLPDKTGRASVMKEASATRLTTAKSGIDGSSLGAANGLTESVTMAQANMPNVTLAVTGTVVTASSVAVYKGPIGSSAGFVSGGGGAVNWVDASTTSSTLSSSSANSGGSISLNSASINGSTTQTVMNNVQPTIVCNYIIRVI